MTENEYASVVNTPVTSKSHYDGLIRACQKERMKILSNPHLTAQEKRWDLHTLSMVIAQIEKEYAEL